MLMGRSGPSPGAFRSQIRQVLTSPGVREWAEAAAATSLDPPLRHRLELLEARSTDAAIEQRPDVAKRRERLSGRVVRFRPRWNGRTVGSAEVQRRASTDPIREHRRRAWAARQPLERWLEPRLRDLARRRNEHARQFGFRNFYEWRATREGFSLAQIEELIDSIAPLVRAASRLRRERFREVSGEDGWYPWDSSYFGQLEAPLPPPAFAGPTMVPTVLRGVAGWGFRRSALTFRIDRHDLPSGGIELAVDPPRDVRVIVHPDAGWVRYMILFHEVGHAVQARSKSRQTPLVRWHDFVSGLAGMIEGFGTLFEEIPRSTAWLETRPEIDRARAERFAHVTALGYLSGFGWLLAKIRLEIELYRRPDSDLRSFAHRWERRLGAYDEYPAPPFADFFLVDEPAYLQSYLFARLFARQLLAYFETEWGPTLWPNPKIGPWLVDHWFRETGTYAWVPHVRETTGRAFGPAAFDAWARSTLATAPSS